MEVRRSVAMLALAGSTLAGGVILGPALALAQEDGQEQPAPEEGERMPCRGPHGRGQHLEVAAGAIGIEVGALRDALRDGQTIAEVAQANGVEVQAVVDALVADISARIDQAVADGRLTQEEADEKKAELPERVTARVNGERPDGPPREGPRPPEGDEPPAETGSS